MQKKIFVSSTVYDLIDIRSEVETLLREMGFAPVLSDSLTSDFKVAPDKNSIESCLANVRSSDYLIVILSKRYGPSLSKIGYGDYSATHLEYNEARSARIPVLFYVRDRLESDYRIWKKNGKKHEVELSWVESKDYNLLTFLDEHQRLSKQIESSNWYQTFENSIELKRLMKRDLHFTAAEGELRAAIKSNKIPMMFGDLEVADITQQVWDSQLLNSPTHKLTCVFTNCGTVPAYNVNLISKNEQRPEQKNPIIAVPPNQTVQKVYLYNHDGNKRTFEDTVIVTYQTSEGHTVEDHFKLDFKIDIKGTMRFSLRLLDKIYQIGDDLSLKIVDKPK